MATRRTSSSSKRASTSHEGTMTHAEAGRLGGLAPHESRGRQSSSSGQNASSTGSSRSQGSSGRSTGSSSSSSSRSRQGGSSRGSSSRSNSSNEE